MARKQDSQEDDFITLSGGPDAEFRALTASLVGYKGHFTRHVNRCDKLFGWARKAPHSQQLLDEITEFKNKLRDSFEKCEVTLARLMELDAGNVEVYTKSLNDRENSYTKLVSNLSMLASDFAQKISDDAATANAAAAAAFAAGPAPAAAAAGGAPVAKISVTLKPDRLSKDATPVEMMEHIEALDAWFRASNMQLCSAAEQQAYFKACLDTALLDRIRDQIQNDTPFLGDVGSCIAILKGEFMKMYPLFTRRLEFFRSSQPASAPFSDWARKLRRLGNQADLPGLQVDDIYVMRYLVGCSDSQLLEELLRIRDPSVANFNEVVDRFEANIIKKKSMAGHTHDTARASATKAKKDKKKERSGFVSTSREERTADILSKNCCIRCGRKFKDDHVCPAKDATCNKCNKQGHFSPVCLDGLPTSSPKASVLVITRKADARNILLNAPTPRMHVLLSDAKDGSRSFQIKALPDSGCTRSILSENMCRRQGIPMSPADSEQIELANGDVIDCAGAAKVNVTFEGLTTLLNVLITSDVTDDFLLSWQDLVFMGILPEDFPHRIRPRANAASIPKN